MSAIEHLGRREQRRYELRQRVRDTGWNLVVQHGYDAITVEDIATESGISVATFYRHFTGKESLLTRRWLSPERLAALLEDLDPDQGIGGAARQLFDHYAETVDQYDVDLLTRLTVIHRDVGLQAMMAKGRSEDVATLAGVFADITMQDAESFAIQLAAALTVTARITTMSRWAELGGRLPLRPLLTEAADALAPSLDRCELALVGCGPAVAPAPRSAPSGSPLDELDEGAV